MSQEDKKVFESVISTLKGSNFKSKEGAKVANMTVTFIQYMLNVSRRAK